MFTVYFLLSLHAENCKLKMCVKSCMQKMYPKNTSVGMLCVFNYKDFVRTYANEIVHCIFQPLVLSLDFKTNHMKQTPCNTTALLTLSILYARCYWEIHFEIGLLEGWANSL